MPLLDFFGVCHSLSSSALAVGMGAQCLPLGMFPVVQAHVSSISFTPVQADKVRTEKHNREVRIVSFLLYLGLRGLVFLKWCAGFYAELI